MKTRIKEPCFNQIRYREFKFIENIEILLFSCDFITLHCFVIFDGVTKFVLFSAGRTRLTLP